MVAPAMRRSPTTPLLAMTFAVAVTACGARTMLDASNFADDASSSERGLDDCVQCLTLACKDLYVQCAQASPCLTIQTCVQRTGGADSACLCDAVRAEVAVPPYLALGRCIQGAACGAGECASVCQDHDASYAVVPRCDTPVSVPRCLGGPVDAGATGARSSTVACEACVAQACGRFVNACGEASDCQSYLACLTACSEPGCVTECKVVHQAGESAADALDVCLGANCQGDCGF